MKALFFGMVCMFCTGMHAQSTVSSYLGLQLSDALIWYSAISTFGDGDTAEAAFMQQGHFAIEDALTVDFDGDGVIHRYDRCPDTAIGTVVDSYGCGLQLLDPKSLELRAEHLSCASSNDGTITVKTTTSAHDFEISLDGTVVGEMNETNNFQLALNQLAAAKYTLCARPKNDAYQSRCYEIQLNTIEPFEVQATPELEKGILDLLLSDNFDYELVHNGKIRHLEGNKQRIYLEKGLNTIALKTSQPCQGIFEASYFVSEEVRLYPNPTRGHSQVYVGGSDKTISLTLRTTGGAVVSQQTLVVGPTRLVPVDLSNHEPGIYILEIQGKNLRVSEKLIRQ